MFPKKGGTILAGRYRKQNGEHGCQRQQVHRKDAQGCDHQATGVPEKSQGGKGRHAAYYGLRTEDEGKGENVMFDIQEYRVELESVLSLEAPDKQLKLLSRKDESYQMRRRVHGDGVCTSVFEKISKYAKENLADSDEEEDEIS